MRSNSAELDPGTRDMIEGLGDEVRMLHDEVMELAERLDCSERVLADVRRRSPLPDQSVNE